MVSLVHFKPLYNSLITSSKATRSKLLSYIIASSNVTSLKGSWSTSIFLGSSFSLLFAFPTLDSSYKPSTTIRTSSTISIVLSSNAISASTCWKTSSTMAQISIYKSSSRSCCSINFMNLAPCFSSKKYLSPRHFHTLKLGSLPLSMRWFFVFATMHKSTSFAVSTRTM